MAYQIITINREFESMGNEIAQAVAQRLHIPYVDKFLITESAQKSGFKVEHIEARDEQLASRFEYSQAQASHFYGSAEHPFTTNDSLAAAQFEIIRELAAEGPCVIVGRCANYVLRNRDDVLDVFIHASLESRLQSTMERLKLSRKEAQRMLRRTDKARKAYYRHHTGVHWDDPDSYHLVLNSARLGLDACVELIVDAFRKDGDSHFQENEISHSER